MQKFVLPVIVILIAVGIFLLLGRLGLWDSTGYHARKQVKKTFLEGKDFENDLKQEDSQDITQ